MVRKVTFDLKLSLRLAGSPPPSTEGGKFSIVALNVGRGLAPAGLLGKVTLPLKSHKDSFVDPCAPRRLVLSVPLCYTSKTSSHWRSLRMTYSRFADAPLLFCITTKFHARRDDAQPSIYVYDRFEFYFSSIEGNGIERLWSTSLKKRFINSLWLSL